MSVTGISYYLKTWNIRAKNENVIIQIQIIIWKPKIRH